MSAFERTLKYDRIVSYRMRSYCAAAVQQMFCAATSSRVRYANRPFGHRTMRAKRLTTGCAVEGVRSRSPYRAPRHWRAGPIPTVKIWARRVSWWIGTQLNWTINWPDLNEFWPIVARRVHWLRAPTSRLGLHGALPSSFSSVFCVGQARRLHETTTIVLVTLPNRSGGCYEAATRGKSGPPALGGTEYRLMPLACRLIVRAKLWNLQFRYLVSRAPMRRRSIVVV